MISTIIFIFIFLVTALICGAFKKSTYYTEAGKFRPVGLSRLLLAFVITSAVVAINPVDVERIDAGHVGIKVSNVGDNRGVGKT